MPESEQELLAQRDVIRQQLQDAYIERRTLELRIENLQQSRRRIQTKLSNPISEGEALRLTNGAEDTMAVLITGFRTVMEEWISSFGYGAVTTLSRRTGIGSRTIRRLRNSPDQKFVSFSLAEWLLKGMGKEESLNTGEIQVVANPFVRAERLSPHYYYE